MPARDDLSFGQIHFFTGEGSIPRCLDGVASGREGVVGGNACFQTYPQQQFRMSAEGLILQDDFCLALTEVKPGAQVCHSREYGGSVTTSQNVATTGNDEALRQQLTIPEVDSQQSQETQAQPWNEGLPTKTLQARLVPGHVRNRRREGPLRVSMRPGSYWPEIRVELLAEHNTLTEALAQMMKFRLC